MSILLGINGGVKVGPLVNRLVFLAVLAIVDADNHRDYKKYRYADNEDFYVLRVVPPKISVMDSTGQRNTL